MNRLMINLLQKRKIASAIFNIKNNLINLQPYHKHNKNNLLSNLKYQIHLLKKEQKGYWNNHSVCFSNPKNRIFL